MLGWLAYRSPLHFLKISVTLVNAIESLAWWDALRDKLHILDMRSVISFFSSAIIWVNAVWAQWFIDPYTKYKPLSCSRTCGLNLEIWVNVRNGFLKCSWSLLQGTIFRNYLEIWKHYFSFCTSNSTRQSFFSPQGFCRKWELWHFSEIIPD